MTVKSPINQPVKVKLTDPANVPETVATGPITLSVGPEVSLIMFSSVRPNLDLLMEGRQDPNPEAQILFRVVVPTSHLKGFNVNLTQALNALSALQASAASPNGGIVVPGGHGNH